MVRAIFGHHLSDAFGENLTAVRDGQYLRNVHSAPAEPLTQIVGGVGLLLAGVLNLVDKLLSGLGLDGLLKGIVAATGLDKIYHGLGLDKWLKILCSSVVVDMDEMSVAD
ncbi:hypothetical protein GGX14DRAFT_400400 [Mycena pura]|uniref:DUF6987 domain-containing protein n=1 Tax=Mycena pura TaxID=153505 RepID=A0AAD6V2W2_9AGAR|nr:hypothetical protein GGX14DRAFT_400400 [Mycena pura]